jgi:hypothetical protein
MGFLGSLGKAVGNFLNSDSEGEGGSRKLGVKGMLGKAYNFAKGVYNHPVTRQFASDAYHHFKNHEKYGGLARAAKQFHKDGNIFSGVDNFSRGVHQAKTGERAKIYNARQGVKRPAEKAFRETQRDMRGQRPPPPPHPSQRSRERY